MNGEPCTCGTGQACPSHVNDGTTLALGGLSLDQLASLSLIALVLLQFYTFFTKGR